MVSDDHNRNVWLSVLLALLLPTPAATADAAHGLELMRDSKKGNCSICHVIPGIGLPEEAQGNIGPPLAGVGTRLDTQSLLQQVRDARVTNPATMMPPYGSSARLVNVDHRYAGQTILTDEEIKDVVAYLSGLR